MHLAAGTSIAVSGRAAAVLAQGSGCLLVDNQAVQGPAALFAQAPSVSVATCTFQNNQRTGMPSATEPGVVHVRPVGGDPGTVSLSQVALVNNTGAPSKQLAALFVNKLAAVSLASVLMTGNSPMFDVYADVGASLDFSGTSELQALSAYQAAVTNTGDLTLNCEPTLSHTDRQASFTYHVTPADGRIFGNAAGGRLRLAQTVPSTSNGCSVLETVGSAACCPGLAPVGNRGTVQNNGTLALETEPQPSSLEFWPHLAQSSSGSVELRFGGAQASDAVVFKADAPIRPGSVVVKFTTATPGNDQVSLMEWEGADGTPSNVTSLVQFVGGGADVIENGGKLDVQFTFSCPSACSGHGTCVALDQCNCAPGWEIDPVACSLADCKTLQDCSGHGECSQPGQCTCSSGWTSETDCSAADCNLTCLNGSDCLTEPNQCDCPGGFKGVDCSEVDDNYTTTDTTAVDANNDTTNTVGDDNTFVDGKTSPISTESNDETTRSSSDKDDNVFASTEVSRSFSTPSVLATSDSLIAGLSPGLFFGVVGGGGALVVIIVLLFVCLVVVRRSRQPVDANSDHQLQVLGTTSENVGGGRNFTAIDVLPPGIQKNDRRNLTAIDELPPGIQTPAADLTLSSSSSHSRSRSQSRSRVKSNRSRSQSRSQVGGGNNSGRSRSQSRSQGGEKKGKKSTSTQSHSQHYSQSRSPRSQSQSQSQSTALYQQLPPKAPTQDQLQTPADPDWSIDSRHILEADEVKKIKILGSGNFGEVWKCDWQGVPVARKEVKGFDKASSDQLVLEAQRFQSLRPHPNVVTFYGVILKPTLSVVIEYCVNGSLDEALYGNGQRQFTAAKLLDIARGTVLGVAHLHRSNIIHRDLAARNVLLDGLDQPKVTDFGMSRELQTAAVGQQQTNATIGPIKWMAPEQMANQAVSTYADVWSLGVVLFEIFARSPPWPGLRNVEVAHAVMGGRSLEPPLTAPKHVQQAMRMCFHHEFSERPTAAQLAALISAAEPDVLVSESHYDNFDLKLTARVGGSSESGYQEPPRPPINYDRPAHKTIIKNTTLDN